MLASREPRAGMDPVSPATSRREMLILACILVGYLTALVHLAWHTSVTVDEPSHLVSSYFYWHGHDDLSPRDMPPVIKVVGGWVPRWLGLPIPYDRHDLWKNPHEWLIGMEVVERLRDRVSKVFFLSRLPLLVFPLATVLLLWRWARRVFAPAVALVLVTAFCLEPTALGHGALFKNDLAATFGYFLFWHRAWVYWRNPRLRNAAWLGGALTLAVLAKLSMLFLLAVAPIVVLARGLAGSSRRYRTMALGLTLVILIPYFGAIAACQFDTRRIRTADFESLDLDPRISHAFLEVSRVFRVIPTPEPLWDGSLSLMQCNGDPTGVHFLGRRVDGGSRLYFLAALAMKVPVALQLLLAGGLWLEARALFRKQFDFRRLFWIVPPLLYVGLASLSSLQFGVRLVLPALPLALLASGPAVEWLLHRRRALLLAGLITVMAVRTVWIYPHCISFFNLWVGTPERGARLFADSNVDWGQDLRELATVVRRLGIRRFHLSYFGSDCVWAYFSDQTAISLAAPWGDSLATGLVFRPGPGYYAISATLLSGHMFEPRYRDYFSAFRRLKPIARAGYSIYVYRVEPPPTMISDR